MTPKMPEKLRTIMRTGKHYNIDERLTVKDFLDQAYESGFSECWSHLAPVIEKLIEASKLASTGCPTQSVGCTCVIDVAFITLAKAREVLGE